MKKISRDTLVTYLNDYLENNAIHDSSSNGLQVTGAPVISKIGLAVDASLETYRLAVQAGCQMLIVHHGLIWNGIKYVTGRNYDHLAYLLKHNLNLFASHLPLDRHAEIGNNIQLAHLIGLKKTRRCFSYEGIDIGYRGILSTSQTVQQIAGRLAATIGGKQIILPFGKRPNKTIGIVSGGASDMVGTAIEYGLDCFITGESAHHNHHQAREAGINVIYGGHYHTETCGVKALGEQLEKRFSLQTVFIDVPTIV